jgi:group I intron endonuclease
MSFQNTLTEEELASAGIYCLKNVKNGKLYVGSSIHLKRRLQDHYNRLKRNAHHSPYLQASFNKHGVDSFQFNLLEITATDKTIEREQYWIDLLQPVYNISHVAGKPTLAESIKKKIGDALRGVPKSEEHRRKCGLAMLGKKLTEEHKQQIREVHSKDYIVISPTGERHEISGLFLFAQQYGLDESALASCARGEYKHHKGWQCFRLEDFSEDKIQDPTTFKVRGEIVYIVTKPDGTESTTNNLYKYARQYNLDGSAMRKVATGELLHHKKYRVREEGTELQPLPKRKKPTINTDNTHHFICTAPDGTEYTTTNMPEFAREHNICKESMRGVAKGRLRQYKGWLCRYTPETLAKLTPEQQAEVQANFEYQAQYPDRKPISTEDRQRIIDAPRTPEILEKRSKQRKGWQPTNEQLNNLSLGHCKRTFVITTPDGKKITTMQLVQFAKDLGSSHSGFYKSARTGKPHKGYTVREITDQQQLVV